MTTQGHYFYGLKFGFPPFRKFERVEACSACVEVDSSRDSVHDWQCGNLDHVDMVDFSSTNLYPEIYEIYDKFWVIKE